ncbi:MAG: ATP-binding cassette domain-containing protein [Actinophytocola sp.]|uniref:ABC transporter ATP-binding protein n=1 Tax=Actinophytocola sp. TaxID=1872138 RepID=UPI001327DF4B|nr:ATP-binding cassette domain-containing protein [Actinophytocola sp.]MPZ83526.1 ATP-binding cassette domain-containing protein [Actinophytocola sp.]
MTASVSAPAVEVHGLRVLFGGVAALEGLDLEIAAEEVFVLVGPNGSGKTTLLNAVSGFVPPAAGTVRVAGTDVTRWRAHQRTRIGMRRTFQNPQALPATLVRDLLAFGYYQHDPRSWVRSVFRPFHAMSTRARVESGFRAALDRVGLPSRLLDEELRSLSHGQLKMVDIARALLGRPRLLLLDEPTSGLNDEEVERLHEVVDGLRDDGCTAVLVEHNVQFVLDLADRIAVLHRGELLALGEPRETLSREDVVEAYLGPKGRLSEVDPAARRGASGMSS